MITLLVFAGLIHQKENGAVQRTSTNLFVADAEIFCTGDIVLRKGKGFISEMFRKTSQRDQQFSHAGVIEVKKTGVYVVHVIENPQDSGSHLKTETLESFCSSSYNHGYAIYRYNFFSGKEKAISGYLKRLKSTGVKFDEDFDLQTGSALYCSELIYKLCLESSSHELQLSGSATSKYVGLDDLYLHDEARLITQQTY